MRTYRASSLGYSLEALVAPHLGYEPVSPPEFLQKAFDEGTRIEPLAIAKLRELGWNIDSEQLEVSFDVVKGAVNVVGHIDGIVRNQYIVGMLPLSPIVVEIKCMADKAWQSFKKNGWDASGLVQKYKWQASAYMIATGFPHVMVAWNKSTEELAYAWAQEPFYGIDVITAKIAEAEEYIRDGVLPEGCQDYPCPFFYLHANKDDVPAGETDDELENLMDIWLLADQEEKAAKKVKDAYRVEIVKRAGEAVAGKIKSSSGVTVSTTWVEEKHVEYDVKAHWETRIQGPRNGK